MGIDSKSEKRITAVLVDTSVFQKANFDFPGIKSAKLVSFFGAVKAKEILLLTHPILEQEIEKHLSKSKLYVEHDNLVKALGRNKDLLEWAGLLQDANLEQINQFDVKARLAESFRQYYKDAVSLEYVDPQLVFELYFASKPPFSATGDKKHEFPDAFVIEAIGQFLDSHPNEILLVASNDNDWKTALEGHPRVQFCSDINEATDTINSIDSILSRDDLQAVFHNVYADILEQAQDCADYEDYEIEGFQFINDPDIDSIEVHQVDDAFDVLSVSRDSILLSTMVYINISAHGEAIDDDVSVWSSEEKEYVYISYADVDISGGSVEAGCEIKISYDYDNPLDTATVDEVRIVGGAPLYVDYDLAVLMHIDEDESAMRALREEKGLPRRM